MKKLLLILLCVPLIGFGQRLIVNTDGSNLNLRKRPNINSEILKTLENGLDIIFYAGKTQNKWINVNYCVPAEIAGYYDTLATGWVHSDYIQSSAFHSQILEDFDWSDEKHQLNQITDLSARSFIENVSGTLMINGIFKYRGEFHLLDKKRISNHEILYKNSEIEIRHLLFSQELLIIKYKNQMEYLIVNSSFIC